MTFFTIKGNYVLRTMIMANKDDIEEIIRKFVSNNASEAEIELLQEYFKTTEGLKGLDKIIVEHAADFDKPQSFQFSPELHAPLLAEENYYNKPSRFHNPVIRAIAAVFVGFVVLSGLYFYAQVNSTTVYKTIAGEKRIVTLKDGTKVTLNASSSLVYRDSWIGSQMRSVDLSGEAYFKVMSDARKPFVVNASGLSIKVVGTTFNVKSYDNDEHVVTTLVEGKVLIEKPSGENGISETIKLSPDQQAIFTKNNGQIALKAIDPQTEVGWLSGSLVFEDETFAEIIKELERWFGVTITVKKKTSLQCRFSTRIDGESLAEVLNVFSVNGDMTYQFDDEHHVSIEGNVCQSEN
jgi:ferric-dicitrate binding protein FerR (iron transport regulator)